MSKTEIPVKVKLALFGAAAGWCQYRGCPTRLDIDELTRRSLIKGYFAHIIADSPDGPRGHPVLSTKLAKDIRNIMLLCPSHHKLIDVDARDDHPVELLQKFKREHEERIQRLTSIQPTNKTKLLFLEGLIGERPGLIQFDDARRAVLPLYPVDDGVHIQLTRTARSDHEGAFWEANAEEIRRQVKLRLEPTMTTDEARNVSVFALAPIPLLMVLGRTLGDIRTVGVFQKRRVPDTWEWGEESDPHGHFTAEQVTAASRGREVALALSVSGHVHDEEVASVLGTDTPIWRISADAPAVDFVRVRTQVTEFAKLARNALSAIRATHGADVVVHVFPALPNSLAVEFGRILLPKVDPEIRVYDRNTVSNGFGFALRLT